MISPDAAVVGAKIKSDIAQLRETPAMDRGDVSSEIALLTTRKRDFERELETGQATINELSKKIGDLASLADKVSEITSNERVKVSIGNQNIDDVQTPLGQAANLKSLEPWVIKDKQEQLKALTENLRSVERELTIEKRRETLVGEVTNLLHFLNEREI
jgi:hypothetical protein